MNVILLLLATIPAVLTREPGKLKSAATQCLLLTGLGMGGIFLFQHLAGHPSQQMAAQWPAIMAWPRSSSSARSPCSCSTASRREGGSERRHGATKGRQALSGEATKRRRHGATKGRQALSDDFVSPLRRCVASPLRRFVASSLPLPRFHLPPQFPIVHPSRQATHRGNRSGGWLSRGLIGGEGGRTSSTPCDALSPILAMPAAATHAAGILFSSRTDRGREVPHLAGSQASRPTKKASKRTAVGQLSS